MNMEEAEFDPYSGLPSVNSLPLPLMIRKTPFIPFVLILKTLGSLGQDSHYFLVT
jgi:hypothetical protein